MLRSLRRRPPRVCVLIDTSGSVSDAELGSAILEVAAITRAVGDLFPRISAPSRWRELDPDYVPDSPARARVTIG